MNEIAPAGIITAAFALLVFVAVTRMNSVAKVYTDSD